MRIGLARLSVLAALAVPLGIMGISTASASADTTTCTENSGTVKLSPGLSSTKHQQNITVHGKLAGCSGEESTVTGGTYVAHLKTTEEVTCSTLAGSSPATGTIIIKWGGGAGNSRGTFSMPLTEVAGAVLGGTLEGGPFAEDVISGAVSQTYENAAKCGVTEGHKKAKKINKGSLTGSLAISE